jgi:hypothetical protein
MDKSDKHHFYESKIPKAITRRGFLGKSAQSAGLTIIPVMQCLVRTCSSAIMNIAVGIGGMAGTTLSMLPKPKT